MESRLLWEVSVFDAFCSEADYSSSLGVPKSCYTWIYVVVLLRKNIIMRIQYRDPNPSMLYVRGETYPIHTTRLLYISESARVKNLKKQENPPHSVRDILP